MLSKIISLNHQHLEDLKKDLLEIRTLQSTAALLEWDQEVLMPEKGADFRATQNAILAKVIHEKQTAKSFSNLLAKLIDLKTGAVKAQDLSSLDTSLVKEIWHDWKLENSLPTEFVSEYSKATSQGINSWEKSKKSGDFSVFAPNLEKLVNLTKQKAAFIDSEKPAYDVLLDQYERGITTEKINTLFSELKKEVVTILKKIKNIKLDHFELKAKHWPVAQQKKLVDEIAKEMGFDLEAGRQDVSTHPFTTGFHPTDVRITTKFKEDDLMDAILSSMHEAGHGLYEQGLDTDWFGTPFGEANSMGIHESQSRLMETQIGQSRFFWEGHFKKLQQLFPEQMKDISFEQFYKGVNIIKPSLIRIEADEATYGLHIIIRYEIEQALINGEINVQDLPEIWNSKYQEYMGITPPDNSQGVLQDIHWSCGLFGYFPTYTLGNIYAAQIMEAAKKELPTLETDIKQGNFKPLRSWLKEKIHSKGRQLAVSELIEAVTGEDINIKPYLNYLKDKYSKIYGISLH